MSADFQMTEYGKISALFSKASLAKVCVEKIGVQTGPFGSQLHNEDYVVNGTPIITVEHLGDNRITYQNMPCVSDEDKARLSKYCIQEGDIVFSRVGSVDRRALVRQEEDGWLFSGRCLRVRVDKAKIDPVYMSYFFGLEGFKNYIKSIAVGATMPSLNTKILSDVPIYFPELETQKKMGKILQDLDDKIAINHQINQILESISQAIFKSWFVDFDPVKAKIAALESGEDAEGVTRAAMRAISGKTDDELNKMEAGRAEDYAKLKTTAGLFPSAMQKTELGEVPDGWNVRTLRSLSTELRRGISPKYIDEGGILVINQKCIRSHSVNFSLARRNDTKLRKVKGREIQVGDVLVNSTGVGTLGRVAPIRYLPEPAVVDSHVTVVRASDEVSPSFLNEYMLTKESFIEASGAGSTGQTELRKQVLEDLLVAVPSRTIIDCFEIIHEPISLSIAEREQECQSLTQLRDTLLPKLLSGELEVNAVNKAES